MVNIIVPLPEDLKDQAQSAATDRGLSLDEFVRHCVVATLGQGNRASDPFFADLDVFRGDAPSDLSERHDDYLYGETE
jgi:hypothetical protein